ncbi:MAG TPA: 6-pyruvoyl-tetrahydropterin synthase-related protein [Luteimonas sp.]|nr:6-pyruvoyl-tetrahydropterin synthase-related protein [Luteimonas sp.]
MPIDPTKTFRRWGIEALTVLALVAMSLPSILALTHNGTVSGFDIQYHTIAMAQFHQAVAQGDWFPRWAPDMAGGYGYPNFVFYPPLTYYVGLISTFSGYLYANALDFTIGVALAGSALSMYALGCALWGRLAGFAAAAAYVYAPYHLVVAYVKGAIPELLALAIWPLCLLFLIRTARNEGWRNPLLFGVFMAMTLATNNLAALLLAGLCLLYVAVHFSIERDGRFALRACAGFAFGIALGAFYWLPAIAETSHVQIERMVLGYFRYWDHFATLQQLIYSPWGYGPSGYPGQFSRMLGVLQAIALVFAAVTLRRSASVEQWFLVLLVLVSCVLATAASASLWAWLRPLQMLQFPWRFLAPAMFGASLLVGWAVSRIPASHARWATPAVMALALVLGASHAKPFQTDWRPREFGQPDQVAAWTHDWFKADVTHVYSAYLPATAVLPPVPRQSPAAGGGFLVRGRAPCITVESERGGALTLSTFAYPGWQVSIDGRPAQARITPPYGLLGVDVPAGPHAVCMDYRGTVLQRVAACISLAALVFMLWIACRTVWRRRKARATDAARI